jgi:hypothetical protein
MAITMSSPSLKGLYPKDSQAENSNLSSLNDFRNEFIRLKEDNEFLKDKIKGLESHVININQNEHVVKNEKDN